MQLLDTEMFHRSRQTRLLGQVVHPYREVTSTLSTLEALAEAGAVEGTVVLANAQTAGRGVFPWLAPPGTDLALAVLLLPALRLEDAWWLTVAGALALATTVEACGVHSELTCDNALLVDHRILGGVRAVVTSAGPRLSRVLLGFGCHLNVSHAELAPYREEHVPDLISVYALTGRPVERLKVATHLLREVEGRYLELCARGPHHLAAEWRHCICAQRSVCLGQQGGRADPGMNGPGLTACPRVRWGSEGEENAETMPPRLDPRLF
jgi:BirA family biotin operon repressor/biotin-[acetyl-CoA-carboxylase] ligase